MSAVVSSLAQLIMDPHFRTINGFQSLVQKEWITLGHPFTKRFGRISEFEAKQAPLFQLFLDCVWQMQHQLPASFEFSETYLTSLWDSLHDTVFDTFSFDSERVRQLMTSQHDGGDYPTLISRSVWDWSAQFHDVDIGLFLNPLFSITCRVGAYRQRRGLPEKPISSPLQQQHRWLTPNRSISPPSSERPVRRNSISSMTLPRSEYGAAENSGTDTLGRSWGSRFGLAALGGSDSVSSSGGGSSRWKRIRSTLFHSHGRSFSPGTIEEGLELPTFSHVISLFY